MTSGKEGLHVEYSFGGDISGFNLRDSWVFRDPDKFPTGFIDRLQRNGAFMRYIGLSLTSLAPQDIEFQNQEKMWQWVASGYVATDMMLNRNMWERSRENKRPIRPSVMLRKDENYLSAELKMRALLQTWLLNHRGWGYTIGSLAWKFLRSGQLEKGKDLMYRLHDDVPTEYMRVYIKTARGEYFIPTKEEQKEARFWDVGEWSERLREKRKFTERDESSLFEQKDDDYITEEIREGRQPLVQIDFDVDEYTPFGAIPNWGVDLRKLSSSEILELAKDGKLCDPSCQEYHSAVDKYKALGEFIAPVDPWVFGEQLLNQYHSWQKGQQRKEKFMVLIPAQADETTITGILAYLSENDVSQEEIKENFYFVLADLCPTPLLKIYAHLKEKKMLDVANIVSMNVVYWRDELEEKFDFVAADHFIDLFPPEGELNQQEVIATLIDSLAAAGRLVLTIRCGTDEVLTKEKIMDDFHTRCFNELEQLIDELERSGSESDDMYTGSLCKIFPTKQDLARGIYSLAAYLNLRDVYPIATIEVLSQVMRTLQERGKNLHFSINPIKGKKDKVCMTIIKGTKLGTEE